MIYYELLGVPRTSTINEIRSAYIRKAKEVHPDIGGEAVDFHMVHVAYETLGRADKRKKYDAWLDETYKLCPRCSGRGVVLTTRTFKERIIRPCVACKGTGCKI